MKTRNSGLVCVSYITQVLAKSQAGFKGLLAPMAEVKSACSCMFAADMPTDPFVVPLPMPVAFTVLFQKLLVIAPVLFPTSPPTLVVPLTGLAL